VASGRVNQWPGRRDRLTAAELEVISGDRIGPPDNPAQI
jgi:hypothetical protein